MLKTLLYMAFIVFCYTAVHSRKPVHGTRPIRVQRHLGHRDRFHRRQVYNEDWYSMTSVNENRSTIKIAV